MRANKARQFLIFVMLAAAVQSAAAQSCQKIEFAELEAMSDAELLARRCAYRQHQLDAIRAYGSGGPRTDISRCSDMLAQFDRVIARRENLGFDPKEYSPKITAQCGEAAPSQTRQ